MTGTVGLNPDQASELALRFRRASELLVESERTITYAFDRSFWSGADADRARADWRSRSMPVLRTAVEQLVGLSDAVSRQREQQLATSEASGEHDVPVAPAFGGPLLDGLDWSKLSPEDRDQLLEDYPEELLDHASSEEQERDFIRNYLRRVIAPMTDGPDRAREVIDGASAAELAIIKTLMRNGVDPVLFRVLLEGGQVEIKGDDLYNEWQATGGDDIKRRAWVSRDTPTAVGLGLGILTRDPFLVANEFLETGVGSSHGADDGTYQYEMRGSFNALFWRQDGNTRIQFEGHGTSRAESPGHIWDYFSYKFGEKHESIGPAGTDPHNDDQPYHLNSQLSGRPNER